jgi:hypothetical protein
MKFSKALQNSKTALIYVVIKKRDGSFYDGIVFTDNLDNAKMYTENQAIHLAGNGITYRAKCDLWDNEYDARQRYTATVITYDVWGNDTDGYEVNDISTYGTFDFTENDYDINNDIDIIDFLQDVYFADPVKLSDIDIDGDIECCYISYANTGRPLLEVVFNQV